MVKATDIYSLLEAQQELFEVAMNPSNLKKLAAAIPGVQVGMEFEMVVPDAESDEDEGELEPDYGRDERAEDIEDIVRFFGEEDDYVGQNNSERQLDRLRDDLYEKFYEWQSEKIDADWNSDEGKEYFIKWVKKNVDPDDVADHVDKEEDLFGNRNPDGSDYMEFIEAAWENGFDDDNYQNAYDEFREEKQEDGDFDENTFLRDIGITDMSDVANRVSTDIGWPYYESNYGGGGGENIESIGDNFSDAIGKKVYTSTSYHGARREPDAYSLEPDGSIDASSGEAGLEFISPPMSVEEMFDDLQKVKEWADDRGCYTNRSTGLHINVSVPDYSLDKLDYVKLAVLLGDKYILEQFGRLSNSYAKSAIDVIKDRAKDNEDVDRLLQQLKGNVETIASKLLHSGRTDKFTSINTKDKYVEFRSAGGDWLGQNFDKIENTILRNIVALDAACDPNKYKKEYQKALYKLLKPKSERSDMSYFARYMSGEINRNEYISTLEKSRTERFREQGIRILKPNELEENDWDITYDDGKTQDTIYIANTDKVPTEQAAFDAAKKFKPQWFKPNTIEYITVKPYKFDEALKNLKLYRADYSYKQVSVVAKDEAQAKEFVKIMDPEFFVSNPDEEITITDENEASLRKIKDTNDWVQDKLRKGREWIARPKIWQVRGVASEPAFAGRYYIAAEDRNDALAVLKQLDPGFIIRDLYVNDSDPSGNTYEAYQKAQEDLIRQQDAERANRQAAEDETIDISNLKGYRVSTSDTYMYVVAENGGEAAEIASKIDPERFPNIADITVQDAGSIGADTLIRGMYARQQSLLDNQKPAAPKFEVNDRVKVVGQYPSLIGEIGTVVQISPNYDFVSVQLDNNTSPSSFPIIALKKAEESTPRMAPGEQMYLVTNTDTGHEVRIAADSGAKAIYRATRNDPNSFPGGNTNTNITATELRTPPPAEQSNTRISDLRYYRVQRQDASGRADVAASSPEDAMNRVRERNPTWGNSPLTAELL